MLYEECPAPARLQPYVNRLIDPFADVPEQGAAEWRATEVAVGF